MRKGEEKRQQLLDTAEMLFCRNGYESTSVQDILDVLKLSKGGFYHHFASKEDVLKALCDRRAQRAAEYTAALLEAADTPLARLNAVLRGFMPLRKEEASFVALLMPGLDKPEGRAMALTYQEALTAHFLPLLQETVAEAARAEVLYPPVKDIELLVLHTVNHCWVEAALLIRNAIESGVRPDPAALVQSIAKYRRMVELLLDAPYGTVEIIRAEELAEFGIRN